MPTLRIQHTASRVEAVWEGDGPANAFREKAPINNQFGILYGDVESVGYSEGLKDRLELIEHAATPPFHSPRQDVSSTLANGPEPP